MTSFTDVFNNAKDDGFGPSETLEDGKYTQLKIVSARVSTTKGGKPSFGFLLKNIEEGHDLEGDTVWLNQVFTAGNETSESIFKKVMEIQLGITGPMLDADAERAVQSTVGQVWSANVQTKGDFQNVYLGKRKDVAEAVASPPPAPAAPEQAEAAIPAPAAPAPSTPADAEEDIWTI